MKLIDNSLIRRKKRLVVFIRIIAIFIISIIILDILSRTSNCFSQSKVVTISFDACDNQLYADDLELRNFIINLSEKYSQGILPSQAELEKAVIEVNRDEIGTANGVYCNGVPFVSNDLPPQAELFVRRHELEHAFQSILEMDVKNRESSANFFAGKEYPIGLIDTIVFSVIESRKYFDSTSCYIFSLWKVFKRYFLTF